MVCTRLAGSLDRLQTTRSAALKVRSDPPNSARGLERQLKVEEAGAYRPRWRRPWVPALPGGTPIGRLHGPGIDALVVKGRARPTCARDRGCSTPSPGSGATSVISGHGKTYGVPFRHTEALRREDRLKSVMPHATFSYRVIDTRIVDPDELLVTRHVRALSSLMYPSSAPQPRPQRRRVPGEL